MVKSFRPNKSLSSQITQELKSRLREGIWAPGDRLPSEAAMVEEFGVSRVTVRTSLKELETAGFVEIRQGAGTFVTPGGSEVRTSLQDLRSLTDTLRELGHVSTMNYKHRAFEELPAEAAERLVREPGSGSLHLQRAVTSDEAIVAVSYDWIPLDILPGDVTPDSVTGSTFVFLEGSGMRAEQSIAEIHAAEASDIQWGPGWPTVGVCVLLTQTHYAVRGHPIMFSKTYFLEGRFQFFIRRTR